jgi:hypothetical protein
VIAIALPLPLVLVLLVALAIEYAGKDEYNHECENEGEYDDEARGDSPWRLRSA